MDHQSGRKIGDVKAAAVASPLIIALYEMIGTGVSYDEMIVAAVAEKAALTAAGYDAAFAPDMTLYWWGVAFSVFLVAIAAYCGFKAWTRFSRPALWVLFVLLVGDGVWAIWAGHEGTVPGILYLPALFGVVGCARGLGSAHKLHRSGAAVSTQPSPAETFPVFETRPDTPPKLSPAGRSLSSQDIERISQLSALHGAGRLTDAEFERQKDLIIRGV